LVTAAAAKPARSASCGQLDVGVEAGPRGDRLGGRRCPSQLGRGGVGGEAPAGREHAPALAQDGDRVGQEHEHDRHGHGGERTVGERRRLGAAEQHLRPRRPLAREGDHRLAVVHADRLRARGERVAQQQPAAAAELEQPVTGPERQRVEDRPAREVVHVVGAVDLASAGAGRAPREPIGQPVVERVGGEATRLPRRLVLVAQPEPPQHG
jgi:hypothetical protein